MRRSITRISSGSRGIGCGVAVGGEKHLRVVAGGVAVVRAAIASAALVAAVTAAGPAGAQPPVPFSLRLEVNGSIPPVAVAPGQVVVRRGLFGRPRAVVVPGTVTVPGAVAVPVPPFGFPGIPLPPWMVFNGGEIIVETTPPDVVVPGLPEAAPAQPADPAAAPPAGAVPPAGAAPQPADPPANPAAPGLGAKLRAGGPAPQVARATPAKPQGAAVPATPRAGAATVAAKPARAGEAIAAPLPKPAAGGVIAARPVPAAATPFTREWFAARPDAWRPEATAADWWRPADVAALTAWIAAGAAQAGGKPAEAGGVSAAGGAAEADGLQSVLVLPTGGDEPAAGAAEWLPLGVFAVVPPGGTSEASQQILFVDHSGAIRGNFHDPLSDTVQPVSGVVDLAAGRASWTVGAAGSRFECPLAEFTAFPGKVSVTAGGRVRVLDIVPIPAP
jgi:hypothetical protein